METWNLFIDFSSIKVLPEEQLNYYISKYKSGDYRYRDIIINSNIPLVIYMVKSKFAFASYEKKDLVSVGIIGLIKSLEYYDIQKNIKFVTYASRCIINEIGMYIRKNNRHLNIDSIDDYVKKKSESYSDITLKELIESNQRLEEEYEERTIVLEALDIINILPEREKSIVCMYLGLGVDRHYTQVEIAKELNISQKQVSVKIRQIFENIRQIIDGEKVSVELKKRGRPKKKIKN